MQIYTGKKAIKMKKFFEVCVEKYPHYNIPIFTPLGSYNAFLFLATKVLSTLLFQYIYTQVVVVFFWCSEITLQLLTSLLTATKHQLL